MSSSLDRQGDTLLLSVGLGVGNRPGVVQRDQVFLDTPTSAQWNAAQLYNVWVQWSLVSIRTRFEVGRRTLQD